MRSILTVAVLVSFGCADCPAASAVIDVFHQTQSNCNYSTSTPYSLCDVIGNASFFDIDRADVNVSEGWIDVTLSFNYGGGPLLQGFTETGQSLLPGDVFFYDPANPSVYRYGVPLADRPGLTAGSLYAVTLGTLTASAVLGNPGGVYYRPTEQVWLRSGEAKIPGGTGVQVVDRGISDTQGQFAVSFHLETPPATFWDQVLSSGKVGIAFANATCANDVLSGVASVGTPEPNPISLLGIGLGILAGVRYWHSRSASKQS